MSDHDDQPTLFERPPEPVAWVPDVPDRILGVPVVIDPTLETPEIRFVAPTFREFGNPATRDRAAFVRHHVGEILKKQKTVEAHRSKGKKILEWSEAAGDTGARDDARAEFLMAERAQVIVEQHYAALIGRTEIQP